MVATGFETLGAVWRYPLIGYTGSGRRSVKPARSTLVRHLLLIGGGPIGVASAYIKRFSNPSKSSAAN
jgi:hypothetical protein